MKLTKQESAMVKLAAAWMAPQMVKKATLQDKLAAYGIGLTKQAAGESAGDHFANRQQNMSRAEQADNNVSLGRLPDGSPRPAANSQASWSASAIPTGAIGGMTPGIRAAVGQMLQRGVARNQAAANAGAAVGAALRGGQAPAQSTTPTRVEETPMIGRPIPDSAPSATTPSAVEPDMKSKYPYAYERWLNTPDPMGGGERTAMRNVRLFDQYLNRAIGPSGVPNQAAVEAARGQQADDFARMITSPGTNQYNDAMRMLIQAGRNNQKEFENTGKTKADTTETGGGGIPKNYTGPNRLNEEQLRQLQDLYPAMGDTTNSRRFAGHA